MLDTTNNTIHTANAVLYRKKSGQKQFLLVQETDRSWGFPGGAKDIEDIDLKTTLQRELSEELGLSQQCYSVAETNVVFEFEYGDKSISRKGMKGVEHIYLVELLKDFEPKLSKDLPQCAWFNKDQVLQKLSEVEFFSYRVDLFKQALLGTKSN